MLQSESESSVVRHQTICYPTLCKWSLPGVSFTIFLIEESQTATYHWKRRKVFITKRRRYVDVELNLPSLNEFLRAVTTSVTPKPIEKTSWNSIIFYLIVCQRHWEHSIILQPTVEVSRNNSAIWNMYMEARVDLTCKSYYAAWTAVQKNSL